jgi:hypothetical protein
MVLGYPRQFARTRRGTLPQETKTARLRERGKSEDEHHPADRHALRLDSSGSGARSRTMRVACRSEARAALPQPGEGSSAPDDTHARRSSAESHERQKSEAELRGA